MPAPDANLTPHRFVWIDRMQSRLEQPGEEGSGARLRDADFHHANYGSLPCLKQRFGQVCRGTLT